MPHSPTTAGTPDDPGASRCPWCGSDPLYVRYHDEVWGWPVTDSRDLFAKLCLDGQQAGLSWITILRKQHAYEEAFAGFDPERLVRFTEEDVERLMRNPGIVRNRLKIKSIIGNAAAYLALQERGIAFNYFIWQFVDGRPRINRPATMAEVPATTDVSDRMSKALKKAGFNFVGSTIVYAFMQATGVVNDHLTGCHRHRPCAEVVVDLASVS